MVLAVVRNVFIGCLNEKPRERPTMVCNSEESLKEMAEFLTFVCSTKSQHVYCPAKHIDEYLCPLGDDGICENIKISDWESELRRTGK